MINERLKEALNKANVKKKRKKTTIEHLRAEDGSGTVFFGPSEIRRYNEFNQQKNQEQEQESQEKLRRRQEQAAKKAREEAEKQNKRTIRVAAAEARKKAAAEKKAALASAREAKVHAFADEDVVQAAQVSFRVGESRLTLKKDPELPRIPSLSEIRAYLDHVRNFAMCRDESWARPLSHHCLAAEKDLAKEHVNKSKQTDVTYEIISQQISRETKVYYNFNTSISTITSTCMVSEIENQQFTSNISTVFFCAHPIF
ncbi:hypothetical protein K3495_g1544 [Podosphaera aphanis]|nr:hypothetical protein K3495_g1544 [Podosphaera aphanis]